jgi:hypothetical protein
MAGEVDMASSNQCGPHTELHSNETVRVSRCACGTVHVTLIRPGVTVRMSSEAFRAVAASMKVAADRLEEGARLGMTSIN